MPRAARFVLPGVPHHVTQRGNRRGQVFFSDADRRAYLAWLHADAQRYGLEVLAYCLMSNHVHLVVVPPGPHSIEHALRHLHMRYAQRLNRMKGWKGHVWQGRYFSASLDEPYFWTAIRYVERNPVRAGLVARAEDFPWSSARARCESAWDPLLSTNPVWARRIQGIGNWSAWLAAGESSQDIDMIRKRTSRGVPCGSAQFVRSSEAVAGRALSWRSPGRPRRID